MFVMHLNREMVIHTLQVGDAMVYYPKTGGVQFFTKSQFDGGPLKLIHYVAGDTTTPWRPGILLVRNLCFRQAQVLADFFGSMAGLQAWESKTLRVKKGFAFSFHEGSGHSLKVGDVMKNNGACIAVAKLPVNAVQVFGGGFDNFMAAKIVDLAASTAGLIFRETKREGVFKLLKYDGRQNQTTPDCLLMQALAREDKTARSKKLSKS